MSVNLLLVAFLAVDRNMGHGGAHLGEAFSGLIGRIGTPPDVCDRHVLVAGNQGSH